MTILEYGPQAELRDAGSPAHSPAIVERLAGSALFDGIEPAEVGRILAAFDEQSFSTGHRVTVEGFRGSDFYIVAEGRALVRAKGREVAELGPGDFFGEIAVIEGGPRTASVEAATMLRCLVLSNNRLDALLVDHPRLAVNLLRAVVSRFRRVSAQARRRVRVVHH